MHLAVTILRIDNGLDFSKKITFGEDLPSIAPSNPMENKVKAVSDECLPRNQSLSQMSHGKRFFVFKLFFSQMKMFTTIYNEFHAASLNYKIQTPQEFGKYLTVGVWSLMRGMFHLLTNSSFLEIFFTILISKCLIIYIFHSQPAVVKWEQERWKELKHLENRKQGTKNQALKKTSAWFTGEFILHKTK